MKKELSTIELRILVNELNKKVVKSKIDRVYQLDKKNFVIQLYQKDKGKILLRLSQKFIWLAKEKPEIPETISGFCALLRKYLEGMNVDDISQYKSERIIEIFLSNKKDRLKLIIELFSLGNIILTDENNKIINAVDQVELKDRKIKPEEIYNYPRTIDIFSLNYKDFKELLKIEENISKTLATKLGIGGIYAEELCLISKIDKKSTKINEKETKLLLKNFNKLIDSKLNSQVVYDKNIIKDIVPFELQIYNLLKQQAFDSYNTALDNILSKANIEEKKEKVENKYSQKINKIKIIIQSQKKSFIEQEKISEEEKKKAEFIYENYSFFNEIIEQLRKAREKYSWKEIKEKLKGHKFIKEINEKNNEVIINK